MRRLIAWWAVGLSATGCGREAKAPMAPQVPIVDVTLGDYFFQAPDTIPAGTVAFRLKLASEAAHVLDIIRLEDGKQLKDLLAAGESAYDSSWVKSVGGGMTSSDSTSPIYTLRLAPGNYVMLCYFSAPDHSSHYEKGMVKAFVVAGPVSTASLPEPDLEIQTIDYGYHLSTPLTAGMHTIRVTNPSGQPHELIMARVKDGYTLEQANAWAKDRKGPSPWQTYGGVADIAPGDTTTMVANLPPGHYRIFCFFQNPGEKENHAARGMEMEVEVKQGG